MRILHTGDLHLDSPFSGLDISRAEQRRRELRDTFSAMMRYAGDEGMDMVVISGDLFDSAFVTRETVSLLIREFSALSCPVIIAPGNHDPAAEGSIWKKTVFPENVYIFTSPEVEKIDFPQLDACVYGYGFNEAYLSYCPISGSVEDEERINLLVCHGDTASPISKYAPLPVSVIRSFGADHVCLGHIHNPEAANGALEGYGAYCGCPEGRDFGETGEKGALIVTVEKGRAHIQQKRFSKRVYVAFELNVDGAQSMAAVSDRISGAVLERGLDGEHIVRITLTGSVDPSLVINTQVLSENSGKLFALEVEDSTSPTWNAEALLSDKGIRGELYKALLPGLESTDRSERERAALALRYSLAALAGEDISDI